MFIIFKRLKINIMKPNFQEYNQQQNWLFPPSIEELIPKDHPVRIVNGVIEQLNLKLFTEVYSADSQLVRSPSTAKQGIQVEEKPPSTFEGCNHAQRSFSNVSILGLNLLSCKLKSSIVPIRGMLMPGNPSDRRYIKVPQTEQKLFSIQLPVAVVLLCLNRVSLFSPRTCFMCECHAFISFSITKN